MKKYKICTFAISFVLLLNSCGQIAEGLGGTKRSKSGDEFLVHKKKPLVVPPDFDDMPSPNRAKKEEEKISSSTTSIEDLLNIKTNENTETESDNSLKQTILKKINKN